MAVVATSRYIAEDAAEQVFRQMRTKMSEAPVWSSSSKIGGKVAGETNLFLADWERQHLEALQRLYNGVRQDFWTDGGFAPF